MNDPVEKSALILTGALLVLSIILLVIVVAQAISPSYLDCLRKARESRNETAAAEIVAYCKLKYGVEE